MRTIEKSGQTVDEAISNALAELGLALTEVKVEILDNGSRGLMGIGSQEARVRVTEKVVSDLGQRASKILKELLDHMGMKGDVTIREEENKIRLEISNTPFGGILIGYRGETLNSIQYLIYQVLVKDIEQPVEIEIDIQDYRKRRQRMLTRMVHEAIEKAVSTGQPVELEPMNAYDRKYIHVMVKGNASVHTNSQGEGSERHIMIMPGPEEFENTSEHESTTENLEQEDSVH